MSFLLKTVLLFLKTSSAIIEGVQSILQNICDVIESTFKTRLSTALMKDKSIQSNFQATDNYISNAKPSLLIFNLKQNQKVTITYGDTDNFLGISLSTELETRVQPIGNKMDKYNTSKPHSEDVSLHSDSSVAASNSYSLRNSAINEVEDSKIQTEVMGKSTTSEGTVRNICLNTKDQMSKTEEHVKSFGCSSDEETGGLREILPSSNSSSGSVDALRPKKSVVAIRTRNGKSQSELRSRTAGIKRKHLKNNGLDDCTISPTSEENKRVVSYIPLKRLNLEKTVLPDSSTRTYRNLEHITSLESKSLTEIPSPHKMDSCIGVKSNSFCIDSLCSANINQDVICKDKPVILLTPCVEFKDSTSGTDSPS
ncbi:hypothetical protein TNCT_172711 [Trichonephila clavata]|uniref:Uncharacterized protein n=1 Tax=Trichonephila clavata TaxID=2740835 RepID=A0A8X6HR49_TRICU|nr:hypothetical protein TNCT_172711 [Trichonephila clavata]